MVPVRLRSEQIDNPIGIDETEPRLSWALKPTDPDAHDLVQSAYRVLAATDPSLLNERRADVWDSGRVESDRQLEIPLEGRELGSGERCFWKVRVWDGQGKPSPWSEAAFFEMGLLSPDNWTGCWIDDGKPMPDKDEDLYEDDPAPIFRKEFLLEKPAERARLYMSGLGYCEARMNGERVGDRVLDPGWTTYSERVLYSTYDVTGLLRLGKNAIGVMLGNGWYNPLPLRMWGWLNLREHLDVGRPRLIAQLVIEYADGSKHRIATDESWMTGPSPILRNNVYLGEIYDARLEMHGWDEPGFDDSSWKHASRCENGLGPLRAQTQPPVKEMERIKPVELTEPSPGTYIFDMGRNMAGWARLRVKGPAGTRVRLRFGELLQTDGTLNGMTAVCGQIKGPGRGGPGAPDTAFQEDTYILAGSGAEEVYEPRFTFHAFRYVEVTGFPGKPDINTLEAVPLCAAVKRAGSFECSSALFNSIQEMTLRTFTSNLFSVQSDCPGREKFGYGGDIVATSEAMIFNFDMAAFYTKAVRDLGDAASKTGVLTETAPYVGIANGGFGGASSPPGWALAHPLLQEQLYRFYGSTRTMKEQYGTGADWLELLKANADDYIIDRGISDHESIAPKPVAVTGTAFFYSFASLMSRLAAIIDKQEDAKKWAGLAGRVKEAFIEKFITNGTGKVGTGSQACQAITLFYDLFPAAQREHVIEALVNRIEKQERGRLTTGIFGTRCLLHALTDAGRADIACSLVDQKGFPGWGHMLENDATTLWEHWRFSDNTFSHNHPMFGSVSEWFYRAVGGINPDPATAGFRRIIIRPNPVRGLTWARTEYESARGPIRTSWLVENGIFTLEVSIPPNTTAEVYVSGKNGVAVFEKGSGTHLFSSPLD